MRIWTLHPGYLDGKGLVACWRESLLAQKVLQGATRGYRHHPQLNRFRGHPRPLAAIAAYLRLLAAEAARRGYRFDSKRIAGSSTAIRIRTGRGQLLHEWRHLKRKVRRRDLRHYAVLAAVRRPRAHPLFRIDGGGVEDWEVLTPGDRRAARGGGWK